MRLSYDSNKLAARRRYRTWISATVEALGLAGRAPVLPAGIRLWTETALDGSLGHRRLSRVLSETPLRQFGHQLDIRRNDAGSVERRRNRNIVS
jgi:hypothetical protein